MKLYHWRSKAYEQYGSGHIIVTAESVAAARIAAYGDFLKRLEDDHSIYVDFALPKEEWDQDELEHFEAKSVEFLADIDKEPSTESVILIHGSA